MTPAVLLTRIRIPNGPHQVLPVWGASLVLLPWPDRIGYLRVLLHKVDDQLGIIYRSSRLTPTCNS